ncbi:MAG: polyprenyl synthetase family protein [Anaerolineae bacterium]|nr:polyprenyl synthetase family protein [Anaerolineae bacterium]
MKTILLLEPLADDLELVERKLREAPESEHPQLTAVLNHLLGSGGKRLRPALALLAGRFYPAETDKLVALAASTEMLHTATLVHDDLIDGAALRRGNPTLNASWSPGTTVLAGDYFFARAAALAAEAGNVRVMTIFANTLMAICSGELRQIFDRRDVPPTGNEQAWKAALGRYDQRIEAKTASLFAAATEAAAVLSGAPEPETAALRDYGRLLGMGFQIVDDVLDFQGDQTELGKPVAGDLREGIVTLPALYYLHDHPEDSRVAMVVRGTDMNEQLVGDVVAAIQESGAISQALDRAGEFVTRSQAALAALPNRPPRDTLHALAEYSLSRRR